MNKLIRTITVVAAAVVCPMLPASEVAVAVDGGDDNPGASAASLATVPAGVNRLAPLLAASSQIDSGAGELLYNGIRLPVIWPPEGQLT